MTEILKKKRKLLLINTLSPGDVMAMTASIRDLHRAYPNEFITDVFTSAMDIWQHNPYITKLPYKMEQISDQHAETGNSNERIFKKRKLKFTLEDPEIEVFDCGYDGAFPASINKSNQNAYHFIHGYAQDLGKNIGVHVPVTEFKGDIHFAEEEKLWISQIQEMGIQENFWLIFSGGKYDFTAKWWNPDSYQKVVNHFKNKITFVQCGDASHFHPPLEGVINLVGKTNIRQLMRLMYHSTGVLCPVTFAMHLAAAVPMKTFDMNGKRLPPNRPCVVLAGGREPYHWEAYPHHQYIHTIGALPCCSHGGCWKSRCQPVNDGDDKDKELCTFPVKVSDTLQVGKCQTMITPKMVSERIEQYYAGGLLDYNKDTAAIPLEQRVTNQGINIAHYIVERFRPTTMLDIGCKSVDILKFIIKSGVDAYGLQEDTKIFFLDDDLPKSRISLFDLSRDYWKSPAKFDMIMATNIIEHSGKSAENLFDTMYCNLKPGGVLILTPPNDLKSYSENWAEIWVDKLKNAGLSLLDEETEKLRRLTHRVDRRGAEYVFMRPQ
jgi:ADP-heptose:LPS heptosyltransferase